MQPHATEEKAKPLTEAPSGITGIETSLALAITNLVKPGSSDTAGADGEDEPESGQTVPVRLRTDD